MNKEPQFNGISAGVELDPGGLPGGAGLGQEVGQEAWVWQCWIPSVFL